MTACFYFCFCQRRVFRPSPYTLILAKERAKLYVLIKTISRGLVKSLSAKGLKFELRRIPEGPEVLNLIQLPLNLSRIEFRKIKPVDKPGSQELSSK